jgi:hypothetical protein
MRWSPVPWSQYPCYPFARLSFRLTRSLKHSAIKETRGGKLYGDTILLMLLQLLLQDTGQRNTHSDEPIN